MPNEHSSFSQITFIFYDHVPLIYASNLKYPINGDKTHMTILYNNLVQSGQTGTKSVLLMNRCQNMLNCTRTLIIMAVDNKQVFYLSQLYANTAFNPVDNCSFPCILWNRLLYGFVLSRQYDIIESRQPYTDEFLNKNFTVTIAAGNGSVPSKPFTSTIRKVIEQAIQD
jgi:hypothetical protein